MAWEFGASKQVSGYVFNVRELGLVAVRAGGKGERGKKRERRWGRGDRGQAEVGNG